MLRIGICFFATGVFLSAGERPTGVPSEFNRVREGSFSQTSKPPTQITVFNWNIERGLQLTNIENAIEMHRPDLCIFQEVDLHARRTEGRDVAQDLAKQFSFNYAFGIEFEELGQSIGGEPAFHGQATLSNLPIRNSRVLRFSHQSGFWKPSPLLVSGLPLLQRRLGGRIALVSEIGEYRKTPLVVYNLHLESRGGEDGRLEQLNEVLADAERYPANVPVIIAGDLNTKYRNSPVIPRLREAGYRNCFGDRKERTHWLVGDLDFIFVRGPIQVEDGAVHREDHGSDHYPVVARLKL